MTEPVAYMWKTERGTIIGLSPNDNSHSGGRLGIPLYTAEQLHPRVKMTQAEFDEFIGLYGKEYGGRGNVFFGLDQAINLEDYYPYLNKRLITDKQFDDNFAQAEFVNLWIKFDPSHPEETIEIIPDMKWFVRSKKPDDNGYYRFRSGVKEFGAYYFTKDKNENKIAHPFDTKEEAEKWTNPLTEAVQLPVEGE